MQKSAHMQILEIQEALGRAKDADDARAGGAADPRRWTGLRTVVDARAMLKAVFQAAAQSRVQVTIASCVGILKM